MKSPTKETGNAYTHEVDSETGETTLVPDPTAVNFSFDTIHVEKWALEGRVPKELAERYLKDLEESIELLTLTRKRYGDKPTTDQILEIRKEFYKDRPDQWHKEQAETLVEFHKFLEKHWDKITALSPEAKRVRHSRDLVDNKFPTEIEELSNQLDLFSDRNASKPSAQELNVQISPLVLTEAQDRLLFTLCQLLAKKSERWNQSSEDYYLGNSPTKSVTVDGFGNANPARLVVTPYELAKEYYGRDNFNTDHLKHLSDTIKTLSELQFALAISKKNEKGTYDRIRTTLPMYGLAIIDKDLSEKELSTISSSDLHGTKSKLLFKFNPIITNNIREKYVEFPEDLHLRISKTKVIGKRGKVPQCVNLMRDYLMREKQGEKNRQKDHNGNILIERDEEKLVKILGLEKEWKEGRKGRVRKYIKKAFDVFSEIELIKKVDQVQGKRSQPKYTITINKDFK